MVFALTFFLAGCSSDQENFSQWAQFDDYFQDYPPSSSVPNLEEQSLLHRYRPRFYLSSGQEKPVDFYADYIASGILHDGQGNKIDSLITQADLNRYKNDPLAIFSYQPQKKHQKRPKLYARIDKKVITWPISGREEEFSFLQYTLVFTDSGISAGIFLWQTFILGLVGNLNSWHQLDNYTAVTLILDGQQMPVGALMQHHNLTRSWLFGEKVTLPENGRMEVDIAQRSNELYPHIQGRTARRAVGFMRASNLDFLMGFRDDMRLTNETWDITDGQEELDYVIDFLPPDDAFYLFEGYLGEKRFLPGRDGPPGASYNTFGALKPLDLQFFYSYWREGNKGDYDRILKNITKAEEKPGASWQATIEGLRNFGTQQSHIIEHNLDCLRQNRQGCTLK